MNESIDIVFGKISRTEYYTLLEKHYGNKLGKYVGETTLLPKSAGFVGITIVFTKFVFLIEVDYKDGEIVSGTVRFANFVKSVKVSIPFIKNKKIIFNKIPLVGIPKELNTPDEMFNFIEKFKDTEI